MTLRSADRVRDTTTTTGTGTLTVSGTAPIGYRAYSAIPSIATNDTFLALISHQTANEWEVTLCTYNSATAIARTTVLSSSNAGALVNFSAGTKDVVLVQTAERMVLVNDLMVPLIAGGDAASSVLTLQSTFGAGSSDAISFKTGSQVERMRISTNGDTNIASTTSSTTPTTGALTVAGGVGVGENLGVGGNIGVAGTTYSGGQLTVNVISSTKPQILARNNGGYAYTLTNGTNAVIFPASGSGSFFLVFASEASNSGNMSLWLCSFAGGIATSISLGGNWVASTTTPAAGKFSLAWNGTTFAIYNNFGSTLSFQTFVLAM
jgi:hypothetical protein